MNTKNTETDTTTTSPKGLLAGIAGAANSVAQAMINTAAPMAETDDEEMDDHETSRKLFTQPEEEDVEMNDAGSAK